MWPRDLPFHRPKGRLKHVNGLSGQILPRFDSNTCLSNPLSPFSLSLACYSNGNEERWLLTGPDGSQSMVEAEPASVEVGDDRRWRTEGHDPRARSRVVPDLGDGGRFLGIRRSLRVCTNGEGGSESE